MSAKERYLDFKRRYDELRAQMEEAAKDAFREMAAELFVNHTALQEFAWLQYTPYYNDGEECLFSVHTDADEIAVNGWRWGENESGETPEDQGDVTDEEYYATVITPMAEAVSGFLELFDEDIMRDIFGDHVEVTIRRDGTQEIADHEHD